MFLTQLFRLQSIIIKKADEIASHYCLPVGVRKFTEAGPVNGLWK